MDSGIGLDLVELGRSAAMAVAGRDAVQQVEVVDSLDSRDRPAYTFHFLIDPDRAEQSIGWSACGWARDCWMT